MGAVYEGVRSGAPRNRSRLKNLRWQDPSAIYRLKKEFRVLSDIAHANLASLYELVADGDDWFYTMELVDASSSFDIRPPDLRASRNAKAPPMFPARAALAQ